MIKKLRISNFALIESLDLDFSHGLTAITGESGSGKSLILDAISSLLGWKCSTMNIRSGSDKYALEGILDISNHPTLPDWLSEKGVVPDSGEIIIRKELFKDGKSRIQVNGVLFSLNLLKELGDLFSEIHRQNDQHSLFQKNFQLEMLDQYAKVEELKREVSSCYKTYSTLKKRIKELDQFTNEKKLKMDYLKFQIEEIARAELKLGEEEELEQEETNLNHHEKLIESFSIVHELLNGDGSNVISLLSKVHSHINKISKIDPSLDSIQTDVTEILDKIKEVSFTIADKQDTIDFSVERLDAVQTRLDQIKKLKKKYGGSVSDILDKLNLLESELDTLNTSGEQMANLNVELLNTAGQLSELCVKLSNARRTAISGFESKIREELFMLGMKEAKLQVIMRWESSLDGDVLEGGRRYFVTESGLDHIEFYFSANTGEKPRPLKKVASGGELSRVMLAMRVVLGEGFSTRVMIFDEIDAGLGGEIANQLATKLKDISIHTQVLLITHLQQIAALSNDHIKVTKKIVENRTISLAEQVSSANRALELARMISGDNLTKGALEHAKELLVKKAV